jgi:hypothetical protein
MRRSLPFVMLIVAAMFVLQSARSFAQSCIGPGHTVTFKNYCGFDVWIAEEGNTGGLCTADSQCTAGLQSCSSTASAAECQKNSDCASGQICVNPNPTGTCSGQCVFNTITPASWQLGSQQRGIPGTTSICIPPRWAGRFWGRTGCTPGSGPNDLNCKTAQCGGSPTGDPPGQLACYTGTSTSPQSSPVGGMNPQTISEITFDTNGGQDSYDTSLVNGNNVAMQLTPGPGACRSSGCNSDVNVACPAELVLAESPPVKCDGNNPCKLGRCNTATGECAIGCWDPGDLCSQANPPSILDCTGAVTTPLGSFTRQDLYQCLGPYAGLSCQKGNPTCISDTDCPGYPHVECNIVNNQGVCTPASVKCTTDKECPNGSGINPANICVSRTCVPASSCCGPYEPEWMTTVGLPYDTLFKTACPTAYAYQYDDPTSNPSCADPNQNNSFTITFCSDLGSDNPGPGKKGNRGHHNGA